MSLIDDFLQNLRNLFSSNSNRNQLKRRSENLPNYSGLAKYRKVNSYFPKTINKPFEEFGNSNTSNEMKNSLNKDENRFFTRIQPSGTKLPTYADYEFSDDDDEQDNLDNEIFLSSKSNRNLLQRSNLRANNGVYKERPILNEENYKKRPVVYNVPIQIERKSKPPPLRDVRTGDLLTSTCTLPIYPIQKPRVKNISNGFDESELNLLNQRTENNSNFNNVTKQNISNSSSLISKSFNLQERESYLKLLSTFVPSLYKTETSENSRRKLTDKARIVDKIDLTNKRSTCKPEKVISLVDDDDDEDQPKDFIDLCDDEIKGISKYEKETGNETRKNNELPYVEPINSLKQKLTLQPKLQNNWLSNFKGKYTEKSILRQKQIQEEEENVKKLTEETAKQEKLLQDRLKNVILHTEPILLDDYEEEEEVEFPEFTQEQIELIKNAVYKGPPDEVLISKFNINITRNDINTLMGDNWLNDEVINFYMNLLMERGEKRHMDGYPKVYAMNTFFIPRLMQSGYSGVRRWTRKVDIFSYDIIPVPVHVGGVHWCMAIIHLKNRTIKYYDSMGTPNPKVLNALEQYLKDEAVDKKNVKLDTSGFVKESVADVPRQMNGSDCGVFSCMFAEYITRNKEITFTQQHMRYFRQKMILEIITGKLML